MNDNEQIRTIIKEITKKNWEMSTENYMLQQEIQKLNQVILPQEEEMKTYAKQQNLIKKRIQMDDINRKQNIQHLKNRISLINTQIDHLNEQIEDLNLELAFYQKKDDNSPIKSPDRKSLSFIRECDI